MSDDRILQLMLQRAAGMNVFPLFSCRMNTTRLEGANPHGRSQ